MRSVCIILFFGLLIQYVGAVNPQAPIVKFNETYELANVILALTDYGRSDKNEVNKNSTYYQEVLAYFDQQANHPILKEANYSRALWDKLLSFRTDAVAFEFDDDGKLYRKHKFYSMGKEINEFERNLKLIEDFAKMSDFRKFYKDKKPYFDSLQSLYERSLFISDIEKFLSKEFKINQTAKHQIIVSPLVGRMHCQRFFNRSSTSFINIPDYLLKAKSLNDIDEKDIAMGLHMLFTEIDHDYVNPTTSKYKKLYKKSFIPAKWDKGSGYENSKYATFNEYMTWAVYDVFIREKYPLVADKVIGDWHKINVSRGFFASPIFGEQLSVLYANKNQNETIYDLYPKLLEWCAERGNDSK
jgi:hypothetical protein